MNRRHADFAAATLVAIVVLGGLAVTWQAYQEWRALEGMGEHMGTSMAALHGTHPFWYLVGTIVAGVLVGGAYVLVREQFEPSEAKETGSPDRQTTDHEAVERATGEETTTAGTEPDRSPIELLPEDERRILEPVIESPGITQIEVRDRSEFSKSKVSQTVTDLEKRGLLYRERQGRTYRVYPTDEIADRDDG